MQGNGCVCAVLWIDRDVRSGVHTDKSIHCYLDSSVDPGALYSFVDPQ